jgi:hypothetical protein
VGKTKKNEAAPQQLSDQTIKACANCTHALPATNEESDFFCEIDAEHKGRSDSCSDDFKSRSDAQQEREEIFSDTTIKLTDPVTGEQHDVTQAFRDPESVIDRIRNVEDFDLYKIKGFKEVQDSLVNKIYKYLTNGGGGDPSLQVKIMFKQGVIEGEMKCTLPNDIKIPLAKCSYIRENGTIRLPLDAQESLFKKEQKQ